MSQSIANYPCRFTDEEQGVLGRKFETVLKEVRALKAELKRDSQASELLTKNDVANVLNVSLRTVDTLLANGELEATRIRGCVRFTREAVDRYIHESTGLYQS